MTPQSVHDIRNIALLGHTGAGKTTLAEALLVASGTLNTSGSVERGSTVSDFDPLEQEMGHSLATSVTHFESAGHWINLLDTPGLPDLAGRALQALPAVETAAIVINAGSGIESGTRRMMKLSAGKCRMIVINRIDGAPEALPALMDSLAETFGPACLPLNLPSADGTSVIDCFFNPDFSTPAQFSSVRAAHDSIVDQVVELDEALMARYLEQGESLSPEQLHAPFEQALREAHLIPVCFVSARTGAGIPQLLRVIAELMPDPTEGNPPEFLKGPTDQASAIDIVCDAQRHVVAHVFQVSNDPYRGKLGLFRVHQGRIATGNQLFVGDGRKAIKAAHLYRLQGRQQMETPFAVPGDICALARIDELHRDAVLHDSHDEDMLLLKPLPYPQPVHGLVLTPQKQGDEQKLSDALTQLSDEDPCLEIGFDARTRQTVVRDLGEQHLKILLRQLQLRWNLTVDTSPPAIPYRETVAATGEARYRHKKQSGGAGQFGEVALRVESLPRNSGIVLDNQVKGGTIPTHFLPAVEKGVRQALSEGALAGYPVQDVRVVLLDGKHHAVDSNEISFVTAARHATLEALQTAKPVLLEPLLEIQTRFLEAHFGEISAELASRRGRLTQTDSPGAGWMRLTAIVPMAGLDGFEARLKAICAGDSEFTLEAAGYEPAPGDTQKDMADRHRQQHGA